MSSRLPLATLCFLALTAQARAQGTAGMALWTAPIANAGVPAAPSTDISINPTSPTVYVAENSTIYAFNASASGGGAVRWSKSYAPTTFANFPSPVPLKGGQNVVFFGGSDGRLYAVKASDGSLFWAAPKDLRRGSCPTDGIIATPAVQLWNYSNAAFRAASSDDLVFVPTRYGCSTTSANVVYAIRASDGSIAWTFNGDASYAIDFASEGCALDYANNRAYCAFNQPAGQAQNTLFALDTATALGFGHKIWAGNAGSIRTRPALRNGLVYVASYDGWLRTRDAASGAAKNSIQVTSTYSISKNPWVETRLSGGLNSYVVLVDSGGNVYAYTDAAGYFSQAWTHANYGATSMMAAAPGMNRIYVGKQNGSITELEFARGLEKQSLQVGSATGAIYDPSLGNEASSNGPDGDRLYVASTAQLGLFSIPFTPCTPDGSGGWTCATSGSSGTCYPHPPSCSTGNCYDTCTDGCSTWTTALKCGAGTECCQGYGLQVCSNPNSDTYNCGGCGLGCPSGTGCFGGICSACSASCGGTTPLCNSSNQCICDPYANSCSSLGSQYVCNRGTGACQCIPNCTGRACGPDGCGGSCGSCAYRGPNAYCDGTGTCQCTPSCGGAQCGADGCNNQCGYCGGSTPVCNGTVCQCNATSCPAGQVCYGGACCAPNCAGKSCGSDGCGGSCGSCGGTAPDCNGAACVCNASSCNVGDVCYGGSCCTPSCVGGCVGGDNGCGGTCKAVACRSGFQCCPDGSCASIRFGGCP